MLALACPKKCVNGHNEIEIPKEKRWPRHDKNWNGHGMTDREICGHLEGIYDVEVPPYLISRVTNAVLDEVCEWQNRT